MNPSLRKHRCHRVKQVLAYALHAIPSSEVPTFEAHLASCPDCQQELGKLRSIVAASVAWPASLLRPVESLWERLACRIAAEEDLDLAPLQWSEPQWESVAVGISYKLLATDSEHDRVSMLVRLEPGAEYPPHRHAGFEELYLLDGDLWIDDKKLYPGDYNCAKPGTVDKRVWTETGCTCVLITSPGDVLR